MVERHDGEEVSWCIQQEERKERKEGERKEEMRTSVGSVEMVNHGACKQHIPSELADKKYVIWHSAGTFLHQWYIILLCYLKFTLIEFSTQCFKLLFRTSKPYLTGLIYRLFIYLFPVRAIMPLV